MVWTLDRSNNNALRLVLLFCMKSGTPSPSASSITLSLMHEHRSRTNWSMFVFKLHTFDKRLLKVEAASFFFCQRAKLDKKWEMLSFNSSFYYTLWVWLSQCCWSWQLLCQHFHNGVHYFLKWSSLVFIIYGISCTAIIHYINARYVIGNLLH